MINFPESLPFLGLASNNCTYTTSHNRKKDLLQIFFHRPSFNNNFVLFISHWRTTSSGFLDVHRSECMWFCLFFNLSPSLFQCFHFLLFSTRYSESVCVFLLLILAVLPLLFCLMLFVLFFDLLYFSAKFSIFLLLTFRVAPYIFFFSFIFSLIHRMIHKTEKEKQSKLAPSVCAFLNLRFAVCQTTRFHCVGEYALVFGFPIV